MRKEAYMQGFYQPQQNQPCVAKHVLPDDA